MQSALEKSVPRESSWPPDYFSEYQYRNALIDDAQADRAWCKVLMQHYADNPLDWIRDWGITYDPRRASADKVIPFVLFEKQRQFVVFLQECLTDKESGLIEKSRDIGATWICCAFSVWLWLFHSGASIGWGSRDQDTVDLRGNPDSIFEKMRLQIDHLPAWMLPRGFDHRMHLKFMTITNPENGSSIKGDAGDNIGRGGRSLIYFKDESAWYERPEQIEAALGDNTDVQIDISSVHGTANVFYRKRMAGVVWSPGQKIDKGMTRVFVFDWRDHPGKTQEWYDNRRAKAEREGMLHILAQEVDRDYSSAVVRTLIPAGWVRASIDAHVKLGIKDDGEKISALDVADEGGDKNAFAARHGVILKHVQAWGEGDTTNTANLGVHLAREWKCTELDYDCIGVGAGVKGETNRLKDEGKITDALKILPWNAAESPENPIQRVIADDPDSPTNEDFYLNRKAQGWWSLRLRFEKTYKAVMHGIVYPHEELISIPSTLAVRHQLEQELSQPVWTHNGKGKMLVDKKPEGALSPNLADAVMMCYLPLREYGAGLGYLQFMKEHVQQRDQGQIDKATPS